MNFRPTLLVLALALLHWRACAAGNESSGGVASATPRANATLADVPALIEQLGSPRYAERRRAEEQLLRLGPDAYDLISQSGAQDDPEINERIAYIKRCLQVDWIRPNDPLPVRRILTKYSVRNVEGRVNCIEQLAELSANQGVGPLVRIARFDSDDAVAQEAALAILELSDDALQRGGALARALEAEGGVGSRSTLAWIRNRLLSLESPAAAVAPLAEAVDQQFQPLLAADPDDEEFDAGQGDLAFRLLAHLLERCHAAGDQRQLAAALIRVVEADLNLPRQSDRYGIRELAGALPRGISPWLISAYMREYRRGRGYAGMCVALDWALERQTHEAANELAAAHRDLILGRRGPCYLWAGCLQAQGRDAEATAMANAAFSMRGRGAQADPTLPALERLEGEIAGRELSERYDVANALARRGFVPWAMREYRTVIDHSELASYEAVAARESLAQWLHDDQQYAEAAAVLAEFCDAEKNDPEVHKAFYEDWPRPGSPRRYLSALNALRYLYAACQSEADGDSQQQRIELERAVELDEDNPDILIALYRLPIEDAELQRRIAYRIEKVNLRMRAEIRSVDDSPVLLASACNQLAWLISNTEGDVQYAVELSEKSLELVPDDPSFLDTLARCYYAAGDLDKAVETQTRACQLSPHVQVMQRQLDFFLAEQAQRP